MSVAAALREAKSLEVMIAALVRAAIAVFIGYLAFAFGYKDIALKFIEYVLKLDDWCRREMRRR